MCRLASQRGSHPRKLSNWLASMVAAHWRYRDCEGLADFVLIHGTTQSQAGFDRLVTALQKRGHEAHLVDLPPNRPALLAADCPQVIRDLVAGSLANPIVVAHSGSGLLLPAAVRALGARHQVWLPRPS
jgi:hypothetical protein